MNDKDYTRSTETIEENHQGRNLQRIRIYLGIKQEVLASDLGISQPQVSIIEQQGVIEVSLLEKIATVLGVTPDLIKKFDVERAIYNINSYKDSTIQHGDNSTQNIHPLDKVVELYERLLQSEREKLELFINQKKSVIN
ncbi:helix-turn-helix transcriptional regulator [Flavobacterium ginsenosidimutans]|uniref:Helix-turn-helix transcriptional regulator n=1 Tax=Flavobacterium ginsenosidimutans TaxID=687844 RepID=A0ABZ2Q1Z6_9FLAO